MNPITSYLIVPAAEPFGLLGDTGGQCRIVSREHVPALRPTLNDYRADPSLWKEVGLMNSLGKLVCLDAHPDVWHDMRDCEPLMAGTVWRYNQEGQPA